MSYRGRGFSRGRGGGRGGFGGGYQRDTGPPDQIIEIGSFIHAVEDEMLCSSLVLDKVPHFNAPIFLQNKSMIGKIDEILGPINEVYFSIKMGEGMVASSFKKGDKVFIGVDKLLPIERFLPKLKAPGGVAKRGRGGGRGGAAGRGGRGQFTRGRGGMRGGRGAPGGFSADRGRGGFRGRGGGPPRGRGGFRH